MTRQKYLMPPIIVELCSRVHVTFQFTKVPFFVDDWLDHSFTIREFLIGLLANQLIEGAAWHVNSYLRTLFMEIYM